MPKTGSGKKSQAAMEYLMTYGWSILIIAVVLGSLAYLGVFNPNTYAPRAPAGSCKVFRAGGNANLEGICNGELPQYVAQFNGASSFVSSGNSLSLNLNTPMTVTGWFFTANTQTKQAVVSKGASWWVFTQTGTLFLQMGESPWNNLETWPPSLSNNAWIHFAITRDTLGNTIIYINGVNMVSGLLTVNNHPSDSFTIGSWTNQGFFTGSIADVQIYNTTLDANSVVALYKEGIGGAPMNTANLVGWWPLDGDANDYSGNNNNGVPTNVAYTNQWLSGYTAPSH